MGSLLSSAKPEEKQKTRMFVKEEVGGIVEQLRKELFVHLFWIPSFLLIHSGCLQLSTQPGGVHSEKSFMCLKYNID